MLLSQALRLGNKEVVAFVGGGGKTTALVRLSDELAADNRRVIVTTTTRLFASQVAAEGIIWNGETGGMLAIRERLAQYPRVFVVGQPVEDQKVAGIPPTVVDYLANLNDVDVILVEADGARMRPFKAPDAHEPVVPFSTTVLVPTIGISVIGAPLDAEHVHRPEIIAGLAQAQRGDSITPEMVARVLAHPEGGLKAKPVQARVVVLVNQVEGKDKLAQARTLANLLLGHPEIDAIAIGAVRETANPIVEMHRRVTGIVLAAGAGTRMGPAVKQLLPWRGKTLIENAVEAATRSSVSETIVVLGARAEEIRPVLRDLPVRIVTNPDWAEGHSTSVRVGLGAAGRSSDAAIFINADQPMLSSGIIDGIIQRYRETDSGIVAPRYAGKRGSPVLFQRTYFDELASLTGEQGGREIMVKYPVEYVDFPAEGGIDVDTPEEYGRLVG